jgi:hypothetical protein
MSEPNASSPKADAAIQVKVCGTDIEGQFFEEVSTAFPSSKGVMLETVHNLQEGSALEITHLLSKRTAMTQVKSLGPKLGVSTLVFLEGTDLESLWVKNANGGLVSTFPAVSEKSLMPVPKLNKPNLNRFVETLTDLVESAVDANLRPALEHLTSEIPDQVIQAQNSALARFQEQIEIAIASFGSRLDTYAQEAISRNETDFQRHIAVRSTAGKESLIQDVDGVISQRLAAFRMAMHEETTQLEAQFLQRCGGIADDCASRLTRQADETASLFRMELQTVFEQELNACRSRLQQDLAMQAGEFRGTLMGQFESELNSKQQRVIDETELLMSDAAERNRTRIGGLLRELAEAIESRSVPIADAAD